MMMRGRRVCLLCVVEEEGRGDEVEGEEEEEVGEAGEVGGAEGGAGEGRRWQSVHYSRPHRLVTRGDEISVYGFLRNLFGSFITSSSCSCVPPYNLV